MSPCRYMQCMAVVFLLLSNTSVAQVINGSFEMNASPDLTGWQWICGAASVEDAPPGGGDWCIQVTGGNVKGCFPGYAYQKINGASAGKIYVLSGWCHSNSSSPIGIFFGTLHKDTITLYAGDTTSSTIWTMLSIQSDFPLDQGDSAVVVLFGGIAAGPYQGFGYFDLISLQEVTGTYDLTAGHSITISPNPFASETLLHFGTPVHDATIEVFDLRGQCLRSEGHFSGDTYVFHREKLGAGLYCVRVTQGHRLMGIVSIGISN